MRKGRGALILNPLWELWAHYTGALMSTNLVIGDQRDTVIDSQSANDEVILQVAGVVIGQVDDQVDMTLAD